MKFRFFYYVLLFLFIFQNQHIAAKFEIEVIKKTIIQIAKTKSVKIGAGICIVPPTTLFLIMCILRHFPHKKPIYVANNCCQISYGKETDAPVVGYINGLNDNGGRLPDAIEKHGDIKIRIVTPIFSDAKNNRLFGHSWGQMYDCLQILQFLIDIDFVNNEKITGIVCHSLGGARFLTFYDLLKNKDQDFLIKAEIEENQVNEIFEKLQNINKVLVAPLLDLEETLAFRMRRFYIPFSGKLSKLICRYCMPFITNWQYDPNVNSPLKRLDTWEENDFRKFYFLYPPFDKSVGNMHVNPLLEKTNNVRTLKNHELDLSVPQHEDPNLLLEAALIAVGKKRFTLNQD